MLIKLNIDLAKIPEDKVRAVGKGEYADFILIAYKGGADEKGNAGMIAMDVTKAERDAGQRGPIVGNYKEIGGGDGGQRQQSQRREERPASSQPFQRGNQQKSTEPEESW